MNKKNREVKIREVCIDDLPSIFHLGEKLFKAQSVSNLYRTWDEYEVTGMYNCEPQYMIVAEIDSKVVGFALGTVIEKNATAWNYGHLVWLGVDTDCSRMGIASMLFDRFRKLMEEKRVRMLVMDTQADNEGAIAFFKSKGFSNPVDHVYMSLNLDVQENSNEY